MSLGVKYKIVLTLCAVWQTLSPANCLKVQLTNLLSPPVPETTLSPSAENLIANPEQSLVKPQNIDVSTPSSIFQNINIPTLLPNAISNDLANNQLLLNDRNVLNNAKILTQDANNLDAKAAPEKGYRTTLNTVSVPISRNDIINTQDISDAVLEDKYFSPFTSSNVNLEKNNIGPLLKPNWAPSQNSIENSKLIETFIKQDPSKPDIKPVTLISPYQNVANNKINSPAIIQNNLQNLILPQGQNNLNFNYMANDVAQFPNVLTNLDNNLLNTEGDYGIKQNNIPDISIFPFKSLSSPVEATNDLLASPSINVNSYTNFDKNDYSLPNFVFNEVNEILQNIVPVNPLNKHSNVNGFNYLNNLQALPNTANRAQGLILPNEVYPPLNLNKNVNKIPSLDSIRELLNKPKDMVSTANSDALNNVQSLPPINIKDQISTMPNSNADKPFLPKISLKDQLLNLPNEVAAAVNNLPNNKISPVLANNLNDQPKKLQDGSVFPISRFNNLNNMPNINVNNKQINTSPLNTVNSLQTLPYANVKEDTAYLPNIVPMPINKNNIQSLPNVNFNGDKISEAATTNVPVLANPGPINLVTKGLQYNLINPFLGNQLTNNNDISVDSINLKNTANILPQSNVISPMDPFLPLRDISAGNQAPNINIFSNTNPVVLIETKPGPYLNNVVQPNTFLKEANYMPNYLPSVLTPEPVNTIIEKNTVTPKFLPNNANMIPNFLSTKYLSEEMNKNAKSIVNTPVIAPPRLTAASALEFAKKNIISTSGNNVFRPPPTTVIDTPIINNDVIPDPIEYVIPFNNGNNFIPEITNINNFNVPQPTGINFLPNVFPSPNNLNIYPSLGFSSQNLNPKTYYGVESFGENQNFILENTPNIFGSIYKDNPFGIKTYYEVEALGGTEYTAQEPLIVQNNIYSIIPSNIESLDEEFWPDPNNYYEEEPIYIDPTPRIPLMGVTHLNSNKPPLVPDVTNFEQNNIPNSNFKINTLPSLSEINSLLKFKKSMGPLVLPDKLQNMNDLVINSPILPTSNMDTRSFEPLPLSSSVDKFEPNLIPSGPTVVPLTNTYFLQPNEKTTTETAQFIPGTEQIVPNYTGFTLPTPIIGAPNEIRPPTFINDVNSIYTSPVLQMPNLPNPYAKIPIQNVQIQPKITYANVGPNNALPSQVSKIFPTSDIANQITDAGKSVARNALASLLKKKYIQSIPPVNLPPVNPYISYYPVQPAVLLEPYIVEAPISYPTIRRYDDGSSNIKNQLYPFSLGFEEFEIPNVISDIAIPNLYEDFLEKKTDKVDMINEVIPLVPYMSSLTINVLPVVEEVPIESAIPNLQLSNMYNFASPSFLPNINLPNYAIPQVIEVSPPNSKKKYRDKDIQRLVGLLVLNELANSDSIDVDGLEYLLALLCVS